MTAAQQTATKQDIEEVKRLINQLILENAENKHYFQKIDELLVVVYGEGQEPNGHSQKIAKLDGRVKVLEDRQKTTNTIIISILTAILTIVVVAAFYNAFGKPP